MRFDDLFFWCSHHPLSRNQSSEHQILHCQAAALHPPRSVLVTTFVLARSTIGFSLSWRIFFLLVDSPAPGLRNVDRQDAEAAACIVSRLLRTPPHRVLVTRFVLARSTIGFSLSWRFLLLLFDSPAPELRNVDRQDADILMTRRDAITYAITYAIIHALYTSTLHKHFTKALYPSTLHKHFTQALYPSTVHKHITQALYTSTLHKHFTQTLYTTLYPSTLHKHFILALYTSTLSKHFTQAPYQRTLSKHFIKALYPRTLSRYF